MTDYPWICGSPSKHEATWLGFATREAAQAHADHMNLVVLPTYGVGGNWNLEWWPEKPLAWVVRPTSEPIAGARACQEPAA